MEYLKPIATITIKNIEAKKTLDYLFHKSTFLDQCPIVIISSDSNWVKHVSHLKQ